MKWKRRSRTWRKSPKPVRKPRSEILGTIERIRQNEVDHWGARVASVRQQIAGIDQELGELQERINSASSSSAPEYIGFLANYLKMIEVHKSLLGSKRQALELQEQTLTEKFEESFAEVKTIETVVKQARQSEQQAEAQAEMSMLDELALMAHRRA